MDLSPYRLCYREPQALSHAMHNMPMLTANLGNKSLAFDPFSVSHSWISANFERLISIWTRNPRYISQLWSHSVFGSSALVLDTLATIQAWPRCLGPWWYHTCTFPEGTTYGSALGLLHPEARSLQHVWGCLYLQSSRDYLLRRGLCLNFIGAGHVSSCAATVAQKQPATP